MSAQEKDKPVCFVVMPIADVHGYESGHFGRVYEHILKPAIVQAGYTPVRADDTVKTDYIVVGIIQKIVESEMVVCDFSARNPNVMYELGIRHAFNKPVVLVKDRNTDKVFDIQGLRYTEYDHSLRIDSVQKDVSKVASAIKETSATDDKGINSVVQLAGIRAAEIPAGQQVSGETQLLLSAIASLEKRMELEEFNPRKIKRHFYTEGEKVIFEDETSAEIGGLISDENFRTIGTLVEINPLDERIFVKREDGRTVSFHAYSIKSKGLSGLPF